MSSCAVCLIELVSYNRDLMRQQPTLMCARYHSGTYPFSVIRISFGSSFYRLLFPPLFLPLCLYFTSLQTDSENRSLVRRRIRDGRSRQWRDLCENCHAILMTAIHAVKCQNCAVATLRQGHWLLISSLFGLYKWSGYHMQTICIIYTGGKTASLCLRSQIRKRVITEMRPVFYVIVIVIPLEILV